MIGYIMDSKYEKKNLSDILKHQQKIPIQPAKPNSLILVRIQYKTILPWVGSFNLSHLKDGLRRFKPKYDLFSAFEYEFK